MTIRPRTIVATGAPFVFRPSNGVTWFLLWSSSSRMTPSFARSTIVRSPSEPSAIVALLGVDVPGLRGPLGRGADELLERHPAGVDAVGEEEADARLDPREARDRRPDVTGQLLLGGVRRVVGRDHVDPAVVEAGEQVVAVALTPVADRRVHPEPLAEGVHVLGVHEDVVPARLAGDVDALGPPLVDHVQARPGRTGGRCGSGSRCGGRRGPSAGSTRPRRAAGRESTWACGIRPPGRLELPDEVLHDLVVLGVEADPQAGRGDLAEAVEHHPVVRAPGSCRSSRRGSTCSRRRRPRRSSADRRHAVLDEQADDPEVDVRLLLGQLRLELDALDGVGLGVRVGHVDDRRHAAHRPPRSSPSASLPCTRSPARGSGRGRR